MCQKIIFPRKESNNTPRTDDEVIEFSGELNQICNDIVNHAAPKWEKIAFIESGMNKQQHDNEVINNHAKLVNAVSTR